MDKVKNDIKVLLTKYTKHVKVDDIGGELILYDNTSLLEDMDHTQKFLLKDSVFSGVALSGMAEIVSLKLEDFYGENLSYTVYKNYIYVRKTSSLDISDPIAVVRFVPVTSFWAGDYFHGHFIELKD